VMIAYIDVFRAMSVMALVMLVLLPILQRPKPAPPVHLPE